MQIALFTLEEPTRAPFKFRKAHTLTGDAARQALDVLAWLYEMVAVNKSRTLLSALRDAAANAGVDLYAVRVREPLAHAVAEFTGTSWRGLNDWTMIETTERRLSGNSSRRGPTLPQADMLEIIAGAAQKCHVPKRKEN